MILKVTSIHGHNFIIDSDKKMAEGGQGTVFTLDDQDFGLIKMAKSSMEDNKKILWINHIKWLKNNYDLQQLGHIVAPVEIIDLQPMGKKKINVCGYVMPKLDESFKQLSKLIKGTYSDDIEIRVKILINLAKILKNIHDLGLCFGDLSPNNIFYNSDGVVKLIDSDNLSPFTNPCYISDDYLNDNHDKLKSEHTGLYGAPELVRGEAFNNISTDLWSYSVIAFYLLFNYHPLIHAVTVSNGSNETLTQSLKGECLSIIEDGDETFNAQFKIKATKNIQELFKRGLTKGYDVNLRVSLNEWIDEFRRMQDLILKCENSMCGCAFLARVKRCTQCNHVNYVHYFLACFTYTDLLDNSGIESELKIKLLEHLSADENITFYCAFNKLKNKTDYVDPITGKYLYSFEFNLVDKSLVLCVNQNSVDVSISYNRINPDWKKINSESIQLRNDGVIIKNTSLANSSLITFWKVK